MVRLMGSLKQSCSEKKKKNDDRIKSKITGRTKRQLNQEQDCLVQAIGLELYQAMQVSKLHSWNSHRHVTPAEETCKETILGFRFVQKESRYVL